MMTGNPGEKRITLMLIMKKYENRLFESHDLVLIKKFYYHFLIVMFIIGGAINDVVMITQKQT